MTIKQLGGVFGRNPTFNDVTIEGELTFDGDIDINSNLKVSGELEVIGNINSTGRMRAAGGSDQGTQLNMWTTVGGDGSLAAYQLVFNTGPNDARVEGARFTPSGNLAFVSGKGIDFSATAGTGTSELLDDYEEGVWTPTYTPTTGTFTAITVVGTGRYTKVGRLVTLFASIRTSGALDVTGASGNLKITGLPFACNATIAGGGQDLNHQGWNLGTDIVNTRMSVAPGASEILMFKNTMNGSSFPSGNITVADMSTAGGSFANLISFTASYEV